MLTFPPLALALFVVTPFVLYYSSLYELTLRSAFWHGLLHLHFVTVGALLMGRWSAWTRCPAGSATPSGCW